VARKVEVNPKVGASTGPSREIQKVEVRGPQRHLTVVPSATGSTVRTTNVEQNDATMNMFAANVLANTPNTTARQEDLLTQPPVD
jgi:hypothetical protein